MLLVFDCTVGDTWGLVIYVCIRNPYQWYFSDSSLIPIEYP